MKVDPALTAQNPAKGNGVSLANGTSRLHVRMQGCSCGPIILSTLPGRPIPMESGQDALPRAGAEASLRLFAAEVRLAVRAQYPPLHVSGQPEAIAA